MNELIDSREAGRILDLSDRMIRYLLKSGQIQGQKFGGQWVIDKESVLQFKAQREAAQEKSKK